VHDLQLIFAKSGDRIGVPSIARTIRQDDRFMVTELRFQSGKGGADCRQTRALAGQSFFAGLRQIALNLFFRPSTSS
jgi:hypothetical protein